MLQHEVKQHANMTNMNDQYVTKEMKKESKTFLTMCHCKNKALKKDT